MSCSLLKRAFLVGLVFGAVLTLQGCGGSTTTTTTTTTTPPGNKTVAPTPAPTPSGNKTASPTPVPAPEPSNNTTAPTPAPTVSPTPAPTTPAPTPAPPGPVDAGACLCVFDIDRTLTGSQDAATHCPGTVQFPGIDDDAYTPGHLLSSEVAVKMGDSFCATCYVATVSAGGAGGQAEKDKLFEQLNVGIGKGVLQNVWTNGCSGLTPLNHNCADGSKQDAIPGIIAYYQKHAKVTIDKSKTYFFDDRVNNIKSVGDAGYNAKQVACERDRRNKDIGYCGGLLSEVVVTPGTVYCPHKDDLDGVVAV